MDWFNLTSTSFRASYESTNNKSLKNEIDENLFWKSNLNGIIGSGTSLTEEQLKSTIRPGLHEITLEIETPTYRGKDTITITITGPEGQFNTPDTYCIVDLAQGSTCSLPVYWGTTNAPDAYVYNETLQTIFSDSNQGSSVPITVTPGTDTELTLYADEEKLYDMDRVTLSAKTPTGTLTSPSPQCSLQPSPINPDGSMRNDPQGTPAGCGTELSWSNVQWASPSIFYKPVGSGSWQHLYTITCALNGEVCSGSIHTDDYVPELIPAAGYQFKLVQFNNANSGILTAPFSVTAKRIADAYEFDDGWFDLPNNQYTITDERWLAYAGTISNRVALNQIQANHNFHRPAAYDPVDDVDTFDIPFSALSQNGTADPQVIVEIFAMAAGLDVSFEIQCVGLKDFRSGYDDDIEPITGVWTIPFNRIVSNVRSGSKRTIKFNYFKKFTGHVNKQFYDFPHCSHNRVVVSRSSGQAGENLTYSFVASENQGGGITLDSVAAINTTTYKVELLGDNFGNNPSLSVRENIAGSPSLAVYSSAFFHNQGVNTTSGKDFIRIPILKVARQAKFRTNGLCFKVLNGSLHSNEKCYKIPARAAKPGFMGAAVQSYNQANSQQDIDSDAYVTKANENQLKLWGNSWKKIAKSYTVTPNTEFEVKFKSTHSEGEIIGVGFVMNGEANMSATRFWQLHGTPDTLGNQEHNNYSGTDYKTYKIKIGEKFTGQISHMVFVGDYDNQQAAMNSVFEIPKLYERGITIDAYDNVPAQRAFDDDVNGRGVPWTGSAINDVVHNFHDSADKDWVIIVAEDFRVRTELIGQNAATKIQLYKWFSAAYDSNLGYYTQVNDVLLDESTNSWSVPITNWGNSAVSYAVKVESLNGNFGVGTDYKLIFEGVPIGTPDAYESGLSDDNESTPISWAGGDVEHVHNFHDNNDADWTIVYAQNFTAFAQAVGNDADLKMTVYRWSDADYINGQFVNIVSHFYDRDISPGNSTVQVNYHEPATFVIKVEARNGAYGNGTSYKLKLF